MARKRGLGKKAQKAGGAALFLLLLTVVIVAYVLLLPPADRAALLGEQLPGTGGTPGTLQDPNRITLLDEKPGRLDYLKFDQRTHDLPSFRLLTSTEATAIKSLSALYVKSSALGEKQEDIPFTIDKKYTENLLLSFNVQEASGRLRIHLNGIEIFNNKLIPSSPAPIVLPKEYLTDNNRLHFSVDSPGWLFWRVNEYTITNLIIAADVKDVSKSGAEHRFQLSDQEANNLERAVLWFFPDCSVSQTGIMTVLANGKMLYSAVPDCGVNTHIEMDKHSLRAGENTLSFSLSSGSALIDQLKVKTELKDLVYPIYYFELDDKYFMSSTKYVLDEEYCGNIDNVCPSGCDEDDDKDCCFSNPDNYWCDVITTHVDDRCVGFVDSTTRLRCPSGYERKSGEVADMAKNLCGDDNDNTCPSGCSPYYDKDCCFSNPDNYWCDDMPKAGVESICLREVSPAACTDCPSGYYSKNRGRPSCSTGGTINYDELSVLKSGYHVNLTIRFPNDREDHKADMVINGRTIHLDTRKIAYSRFIDDYVERGINSLEIVPRTTLDIVRLTAQLQKR